MYADGSYSGYLETMRNTTMRHETYHSNAARLIRSSCRPRHALPFAVLFALLFALRLSLRPASVLLVAAVASVDAIHC